MSRPDLNWGHLKIRDGEPIFGEPWHAQALSMADLLIKSGTISAVQWAETLSAEIGVAAVAGKPDDTDTYFAAVLTSLERLLVAEQNVSAMDLARRRDEWRLAYASTPHGHPVELNRGNSPHQSHDCLSLSDGPVHPRSWRSCRKP